MQATAEKLKPLGDGLHRLTREEYDLLDRTNFSNLKHIAKSPLHYQYNLLHGQEDTDAKKLGRATHMASLEPERFRTECVKWTGGTRRGDEWNSFKRKHAGREILTENEHEKCLAIQGAVRNHARAAKYLSNGRAEAAVLWTWHGLHDEKPLEIPCKSLVDFIADCGAIVDLKTTRDASPEKFCASAFGMAYHCQAAFYQDGVRAVTGEVLPYVVVAVEVAPPYAVQVYRLSEHNLAVGREVCRDWLLRLAECRRSNSWPGYAEGELELGLPRWATSYNEDEDLDGLGLVIGGEE